MNFSNIEKVFFVMLVSMSLSVDFGCLGVEKHSFGVRGGAKALTHRSCHSHVSEIHVVGLGTCSKFFFSDLRDLDGTYGLRSSCR